MKNTHTIIKNIHDDLNYLLCGVYGRATLKIYEILKKNDYHKKSKKNGTRRLKNWKNISKQNSI